MVKKICIDCGKECSGIRCKKCNNKNIGRTFTFGGRFYSTEVELNRDVKFLLKECKHNVEFEHKYFSDLINTYHNGVNYSGYKVTKFKILDYEYQVGRWEKLRDKYRGNFVVTGYFEPVGKWHSVTLYPYKIKNIKSKLIAGLREKWAEKAEIRTENQLCENCKIMPYPQLHHDNISFKEIAEKCMKLFTKEELMFGLGGDWWKHDCISDVLSDNHPAVIEMFKLHEGVTYKWLCHQCHKKAHAKKKQEEKENDT